MRWVREYLLCILWIHRAYSELYCVLYEDCYRDSSRLVIYRLSGHSSSHDVVPLLPHCGGLFYRDFGYIIFISATRWHYFHDVAPSCIMIQKASYSMSRRAWQFPTFWLLFVAVFAIFGKSEVSSWFNYFNTFRSSKSTVSS